MSEKIDARRWVEAEKASGWEQSQIQGFFYSQRGKDNQEGFHIIRDLRKDAGSQKVWEMWGDAETYDECHRAMMAEIELRQVQIICDFYREGWPKSSDEAMPAPATDRQEGEG